MTGSDRGTIDMELSTSEVRGLSQAATREAAAEELPRQAEAAVTPLQRPMRRLGFKRVLVAASATLAVLGVAAYWAWMPGRPGAGVASSANLSASTTDSSLQPAQPAVVRFTNPFDTDEVFEFPAGTSQTEAHDAVAQILLDRALERRNPLPVTASTH